MATDIERLILDISATTKGLERGLAGLNKKVDASTSKAEKSFARMNKNILMSTSSLSNDIGTALAAVGVAYLVKEVASYADAWTSAGNKIAAAGTPVDQMADKQANLARIARETRTALEPTVDLYARMLRSTKDLGVAEEAVARATEIVNKAFKAGGGSIQEQQAAITQLGQALGSGVLQGDELRSIRENAPLVAKAIADEFNTTAAGLKKLGSEGKLTSDRVFRAIIKAGADVDAQFARTEATIGDSFQNLRTAAIQYVGELNTATGASAKFNDVLDFVTNNLDAFVDATIVGATILGGVFAGQAVAAAIGASIKFAGVLGITRAAIIAQGTAATASAASVRALQIAMAFFGGPIGLAIGAVAVAIGLIAYEANKSVPPTAALTNSVGALDSALQAYETAAIAASTASGENRSSAVQEANALRVVAVEAKNAAQQKINLARATIAAARANFAERQQNLADYGGDPGLGTYNRTRPKTDGPSAGAVRQARADVEAGEKALKDAEASLTRIDTLLNKPLTTAGGVTTEDKGGGGRKGGRGGATVEDIRLQAQLEEARAAGDTANIRRLEDQLDLKRRIDDYDQAGLSKAEATAAAAADQARINAARGRAEAREIAAMQEDVKLAAARNAGDEELVRQLEKQIELRERSLDYEELGKTATEARAAAEADLAAIEAGRVAGMNREIAAEQQSVALQAAELAGNIELARELQRQIDSREAIDAYIGRGLDKAAAMIAAERDLATIEAARMEAQRTFWRDEERAQAARIADAEGDKRRARELARLSEIQSRSERYRSEGGLSKRDAEARARSEVDAEAVAAARGQFREAFRDGWKAALDGDFESFLADRATAALERSAEAGLNKIADFAFDKLSDLFPDLAGDLMGIGKDAAAGATEGATIGAAMTTAAATGAATIGTAIGGASTTGSAAMATAIAGAGSTAAAAMAGAIVAAGQTAAAAMAAASAGGGGGGAGSIFSQFAGSFSGTGAAGGGYKRAGTTFRFNEHGPEGFSPGFNGTVVPANVMRALAALRTGSYGEGKRGPMTVKMENYGEPMEATASMGADGNLLLQLQPIVDKGIESNARAGKLQKNLKKSPRPPRSF